MVVKDIGLCAALATVGIHPSSAVNGAGDVAWEFDDGPATTGLREAYLRGELRGSLLYYNIALQRFHFASKGGR